MYKRQVKDTPAEREGLQPGDLILEMDGEKIDSHKKLRAVRDRHETGERFKLLILRNGKKIKVKSSFNDCPEGNETINTEIDNDQVEIQEDFDTDLKVFPNPSNGPFNLSYEGRPGNLRISISDIAGKVLYLNEMEDFKGNFSDRIVLTDFVNGTVLIKIENEGEVLVEKLIIQQQN